MNTALPFRLKYALSDAQHGNTLICLFLKGDSTIVLRNINYRTTSLPNFFFLATLLPSLTNSAISNEIVHGPTEHPEKSSTTVEREACKDIHCDYEATCELGPDNFPRCSCLFDCAAATIKGTAKPVCASDLRIYPSMCAMKLEACQRQEELRLRPLELCQGLEVKPCNGETPLVDETTGLEFDCGSGPHRKDCPSGSYCHQTTRAARCCKKGIFYLYVIIDSLVRLFFFATYS